MPDAPPAAETPSYGTTRGPGVSYLEVERAAIALLKSGQRPSVERIRARLGRGSPQTLLSALQRFWRDLGTRVEADPAALTRLPIEIVELVDGVWQRALALAAQAAKLEGNAARERLEERRHEVERQAHVLRAREGELESALRARQEALADAQAQVRLLLGALDSERSALRARESRVRDLEAQLTIERQQLNALIARRAGAPRQRRKPPATRKRARPSRKAARQPARKSSPATPRSRSRPDNRLR